MRFFTSPKLCGNILNLFSWKIVVIDLHKSLGRRHPASKAQVRVWDVSDPAEQAAVPDGPDRWKPTRQSIKSAYHEKKAIYNLGFHFRNFWKFENLKISWHDILQKERDQLEGQELKEAVLTSFDEFLDEMKVFLYSKFHEFQLSKFLKFENCQFWGGVDDDALSVHGRDGDRGVLRDHEQMALRYQVNIFFKLNRLRFMKI